MKRTLPWFIAVVAYVGPPTWAYLEIERDAAAQEAARGWACGNPALGIVLLACIASGVLSLIATGVRGWSASWWRQSKRSVASAEVSALIFPFLVAVGFAAYLFSL